MNSRIRRAMPDLERRLPVVLLLAVLGSIVTADAAEHPRQRCGSTEAPVHGSRCESDWKAPRERNAEHVLAGLRAGCHVVAVMARHDAERYGSALHKTAAHAGLSFVTRAVYRLFHWLANFAALLCRSTMEPVGAAETY